MWLGRKPAPGSRPGMGGRRALAALGLCAFFLLLFLAANKAFFGDYAGYARADFAFHYAKARGDGEACPVTEGGFDKCRAYPPLFHALAAPFAYNEKGFFYAGSLLVFVAVPFLLYLATGSLTAPWLYFTVTNIPWYLGYGYYSNALALALALTVFAFPSPPAWLAALALAPLAHSQALFLVAAAVAGNAAQAFGGGLAGAWPRLARPLLPCGAFLGPKKTAFLEANLAPSTGYHVTLGTFAGFFAKTLPLPFAWLGLLASLERGWLHWLAVAFAGFVGAVAGPRALLAAGLALLPGAAAFIDGAGPGFKAAAFAASLVFLAFQVWAWLAGALPCQALPFKGLGFLVDA